MVITTPKYDGYYSCDITTDALSKDLAFDSFDFEVDMQVMKLDMGDGFVYTDIKVDADGKFSHIATIDLLLTKVDTTIIGQISDDGSVSGTIKEVQLVAFVSETRTGTFTGTKR